MTTNAPDNIDDYIAGFPPEIREILEQFRTLIQKEVPEATEAIKYGMPTFVLNGNLVHFAAFKHHIGFYPTPSGTDTFKKELSGYKSGKGSIQFPLDAPMPWDLITEVVRFRVKEAKEKPVKKK